MSHPPADKPPPVDASQLWSKPVDYSTDAAAKAAAFQDEAQKYSAGLSTAPEADRTFFEKQADAARFAATQYQGTAAFQKQQYDGQVYATRTHNEPIEAALRAQQEAETAARLRAAAELAATAALATGVAAVASQPGGLTGAFSSLVMGEGAYATPPTMMAMGPTAAFGRVGSTAATFGLVSSLDKLLGPAEPTTGTAPVAPSPTSQAMLDTSNPITPTASQPARMPYNQAMNLTADSAMRNGPKRPSWASESSGGGPLS